MSLSDAKVRALKSKPADYKVADGEGLHLLVVASGGKRWRLAYRFQGKQKALALGTYPKVSLLDARKARDDAKRKLSEGIDPGVERRQKKQAQAVRSGNTFKAIADEWFEVKSPRWVESSRLGSGRFTTVPMIGEITAAIPILPPPIPYIIVNKMSDPWEVRIVIPSKMRIRTCNDVDPVVSSQDAKHGETILLENDRQLEFCYGTPPSWHVLGAGDRCHTFDDCAP